jgi:hypothetical protein
MSRDNPLLPWFAPVHRVLSLKAVIYRIRIVVERRRAQEVVELAGSVDHLNPFLSHVTR